MLIIKIKIARCQSKVALTALAECYFIFKYCVSSLWPLLFFVIGFRDIFVLYCSLVAILMFFVLYLDLGLLFVLCLIALNRLLLSYCSVFFCYLHDLLG